MEINWPVLAYITIGIFAMSGFFKGWWKESITTFFLIFLVLLLQLPPAAQAFIDLLNLIFAAIAGILPESFRIILADFLEATLGVGTVDGAIRLEASDGGTWLIILLLFIGLAIFIGRSRLPGDFRVGLKTIYVPTLRGSLLGALIGGFNGLLIINLIREYLDGSRLLGGAAALARRAAPAGSLQAIEVPNFTIMESFLPWVFIALGFIVLFAAFRNRVVFLKDKDGYRKIDYRAPLGYNKHEMSPKKG